MKNWRITFSAFIDFLIYFNFACVSLKFDLSFLSFIPHLPTEKAIIVLEF